MRVIRQKPRDPKRNSFCNALRRVVTDDEFKHLDKVAKWSDVNVESLKRKIEALNGQAPDCNNIKQALKRHLNYKHSPKKLGA
jgi:hypothetical protein